MEFPIEKLLIRCSESTVDSWIKEWIRRLESTVRTMGWRHESVLRLKNPMITPKNPYDFWLTRNSKSLSFKSTEITLCGPWAQWTPHAPAMNVWNLSSFVTGTYTNMNSGCHHHQFGMDYLWAPFSKWPPAKWNYVFVYNSASRIDRNKILLLSEVI